MSTESQLHLPDRKGKGKALDPIIPNRNERLSLTATETEGLPESITTSGWWRESRYRARTNKRSWDYIISSGVAGGVAGCVAKSVIAPLDRVKILFQTSNADFRKYAGTPAGLLHATGRIWGTDGLRGLFQGHSMTLLRVFPYAAVKFLAYDKLEGILIPTPEKRTPGRFFLAGAASGVTSVLVTYPLELVRVRLAFQTRASERTSIKEAIRSIYHEADRHPPPNPVSTPGAFAGTSKWIRNIPFWPFYRGFSITILGMIPYAGVSFLTYGTLKRYTPKYVPYLAERPTQRDLACGAVAGLVSQTASYPFEVIRRRMQVGGANAGLGVSARQAVSTIYGNGGWRGFFVGLSIGYLKVIPMTSVSFATWQFMKRLLEI